MPVMDHGMFLDDIRTESERFDVKVPGSVIAGGKLGAEIDWLDEL